MNIGIVTTWFERGAAYVSKQYMEILQKDFNVFIYARSGEAYAKGNQEWDKSNIYWSKKINSPFVATVLDKKEFCNWIKKNEIRTVLFNEQHWWYPLIWCKEIGVQTVAYIDYYTEKTVPLFAIYDKLICNTKKHYEAFKWHPGAIYLPWGTNIDLYKPREKQIKNKISFFHSCGMNPHRKGTDLLINSLKYIPQRDYEVIIHTQIDLFNFYPDLEDEIKKYINLGILKIIHDTVPAPGLYYQGDIYIYPSRLDGIGLTIAEAISSGLGIIVPDIGPMNEFVREEFGKKIQIDKLFSRADGYYWPQNEVCIKDLAKCISYYINLEPENIEPVKINARKYAEESLDWQNNSEIIINLFDSLKPEPLNKEQYEKVKNKILSFENRGIRKYNKFYLRYPLIRLCLKLLKK